MVLKKILTPIDGLEIELQEIVGDLDGGVLRMLPGGSEAAPGWFGGRILDVYAFTARGRGKLRGGHYHRVLQEMFFTVSGTQLALFSDFRSESKTSGVTHAVIVGWDKPQDPLGLASYTVGETNALARLRVPAGVFHAFFPLSEERTTTVALGTTAYDPGDYVHVPIADVPGAEEILSRLKYPS